MEMTVTFPGNKKVNVEYGEHTIETDQPVHAGGDGSAPTPFNLFLSSIAACAGIYVVFFCEKRGISLDGIRIVQRMERDGDTRMVTKVLPLSIAETT